MCPKKREIVLGVTGSIAAYRACDITNRLKDAGYNITVVMTEEAQHFIKPLTLQNLSGNKVVTEMFALPDNYNPLHTSLAQKADLVLVALALPVAGAGNVIPLVHGSVIRRQQSLIQQT